MDTALPENHDSTYDIPDCPVGDDPELEENRPDPENGSCPVVGIGASAGGLEAFTKLLQILPPDTGLAFVLVQHLSPTHESILAELLASHTTMAVSQAVADSPVEPNHVYVIPPNTRMAIDQGILRLTPRDDSTTRNRPIDYFFCSLAKDQRSRAVGVVLSGSASDGTIGLKAIKSVGGITFAQDKSARFDSMPMSAVAAGVVHFILAPDEIAREIAGIAQHFYLGSPFADSVFEDSPALSKILNRLLSAHFVDFTHYKRPTIKRRLGRRMALHRIENLDDYRKLLEREPAELNALFDDLLIHVTEFFRDPKVFEALTASVFPRILQNRRQDETVRIWVPGCSSGEEVYSIAICLAEYMESTGIHYPVQIFATDISHSAIQSARVARFLDANIISVSPERLSRFFVRHEGGAHQISRAIRDQCIFSRHDITKDPPLSRMDIISCRNLLIYLGTVLQRRVIANFSYALQPAGCLVLGHSESLGSLSEHFNVLDREQKVFTRNLNFARPRSEFDLPRGERAGEGELRHTKEDSIVPLDREADRYVAETYGPCGLLLNSRREIIRFRGDVGRYISPPTGLATLDVLKLVRPDLVPALSAALDEANTSNVPVRKTRVPVTRNQRLELIHFNIRPILNIGTERYFLILFEEATSPEMDPAPVLTGPGDDLLLARELSSTRTYLQALIEELRTANEEAQSSNEELQSTNEELETAKEELQSSNEELSTTNDEMKSRNSDLGRANNDLLNLLTSLDMPVIMLNKDLRIRRYTPQAGKALNLISTDIGRPLSDLKLRIDVPNLDQLLGRVIYTNEPFEQNVQDREGHWFSMRLHPYRTSESKAEGAVLQLLDIDPLKRTLTAAEHARLYAETIFDTVREPLVVLDKNFLIQTANLSFFSTFQLTPAQTLQRPLFEIANGLWDSPKVRQLLLEVSTGQSQSFDVDILYNLGQTAPASFQLNARLLRREGDEDQILFALEDVTYRTQVAEAKYRRLFETAKDGIVIADAESGAVIDANPFLLELFGMRLENIVGQAFWQVPPLSAIPDGPGSLARLRKAEIVRLSELAVKTRTGRDAEFEVVANLYTELQTQVIQFNIRDVTERNEFERRMQQSAKLESLGLLAGGVAHDFNNLLTGIMGNASLLLDFSSPADSNREFLREIVKATQRAADLTRQMLAYSGRGRFTIEAIDLSGVAREMANLVRSSIPKIIEIEFNLAKDLPPVEADATQIRQLIMNLVINGAEAVPEGKKGSVRVSTSLQQITPEFIAAETNYPDLKPGTFVKLEITDSGIGMNEATIAKIFDPFFTTKFTGRGLGLAAASGIVRGHHGTIQVQSTPGQGTTFSVFLPASPTVQLQNKQEQRRKDLSGSGLILVVDDEEMVLRLASPALQRYGYQVITAVNGDEAVNLVREKGTELDLVILDLTMPVMGGEEALTHIKKLRPDLPVILSSGYNQTHAASQFGTRMLAGFIQKPYSIQSLLEAVKTVLTS